VFVFQDGRLEGLLDYTSQGALEQTQPILLFAMAFGLSTDYGVFLLSRIKEARDNGAGERESVAIGLERTGRIVSAAALLFFVAIGAFATSSIIFIKEVGLGTALAVMIDATIVRALLVPSLMALLGRWNWWAPRPLAGLHRRLGLREA
jgi:RND superfamily putative drug exporter